MITAEQYLERVKANMVPREDFEVESLIMGLEIAGWRHSEMHQKHLEAKRELYDDLPKNHPMFLKIAGWALFFEMHEAKKMLADDALIDSFIYDRRAQIFVLNIERGGHEMFTSHLYRLYTGAPDTWENKTKERDAERFIEEDFGIVLSSRAGKALRSTSPLNAQERIIFADFPMRTL